MRKCYHINSIQLWLLFIWFIFIHSVRVCVWSSKSKERENVERPKWDAVSLPIQFCSLSLSKHILNQLIFASHNQPYHHNCYCESNNIWHRLRIFSQRFWPFFFPSLLFLIWLYTFPAINVAAFPFPRITSNETQREPTQNKFHLLLRQICHNFFLYFPCTER